MLVAATIDAAALEKDLDEIRSDARSVSGAFDGRLNVRFSWTEHRQCVASSAFRFNTLFLFIRVGM